jgi:phosphopantothenoylcysteine synthetase/decarboxylase
MGMRILVTAGNTQTPIDDVRVITNVFSGRTGSAIALAAHDRGHAVSLLTSNPELVAQRPSVADGTGSAWEVFPYRTFDDLQALMQRLISNGQCDVIIHSAAVSDYQLAGTFAPSSDTYFDPDHLTWGAGLGVDEPVKRPPTLVDIAAGKVKSNHREVWMRMVPTPKLIDSIRKPWGFDGILVKFKLEVDISDEELIKIAEASRTHSSANLIVANTLSGMRHDAFLGPVNGQYERVERSRLATRLLDEVELLAEA